MAKTQMLAFPVRLLDAMQAGAVRLLDASCDACGWNGSRDYATSLNIARLGLAFLLTYQRTQRYTSYRMTSPEVNPCSYSGRGAMLLLPSQGVTSRPLEGKTIYYARWSYSIALRMSQTRSVLTVLVTSAVRKRVYDSV